MKLNIENLSLDSRIDFIEDNKVVYYGIYDFSYKRRIRIFDGEDNELGYVQLQRGNIVEDVICCDKKDIVLNVFDKDCVKGENYNFVFEIDGKQIMSVNRDNNECIINASKDNELLAVMNMIAIIDMIGKQDG